MTRIGNDTASAFEGLEERWAAPGAKVRATDLADSITHDQALVYQQIIGTDIVGSPLSNITPHTHDDTTGALLGWPLSTITFLDGGSADTGADNDNVDFPQVVASNCTTDEHKIFCRWPVFIPEGVARVVVNVKATENFHNLRPRLKVYNTSFTQQGSTVEGPSQDRRGTGDTPRDFYFEYDVQNDGQIQIFEIDLYPYVQRNSDSQYTIWEVRVYPEFWLGVGEPPGDPILTAAATTATVPASYIGLSSDIVSAGESVNSYTLKTLSENDALIYERLTGEGAYGLTPTLTATPHDHEGANSKWIDTPILSVGLGSPNDDSSDGFVDETGTPQLNYGNAPYLATTASQWVPAFYCVARIPNRSGALTVNWGVVTWEEDTDDTSQVEIAWSTDASSWVTQTAAVNPGHPPKYHYTSGTCTASPAPNADTLYYWRVRIHCDCAKGGSGSQFALCGFALWLTDT